MTGVPRIADQARGKRGLVRCSDVARRAFRRNRWLKNESDANEWIAKKFQAWLEDREKKDATA
jgi:hypothetical protein